MTIIQPNKLKGSPRAMLAMLIFIVILFSGLSIITYTRQVDLRHRYEAADRELSRLLAENAELKEQLYDRLDFSELDRLVVELGLVKETAPDYFLALAR